MHQTNSFAEFLEKMQAAKYEVKQGKYIFLKPPYGQGFIRLKPLGSLHDEFSLKNRLKAKNSFESRLDKEIKDLNKNIPNLCVLQEVQHYIAFI